MPQNQGWRNAERGRSDRNRGRARLGQSGRQVIENLDESSPTVKMFLEIKEELDDNHNRYERIVKLSRDATIESKRIIFLLHTLDRESKREAVLSEAEERIAKLNISLFRKIAEELRGRDAYDFWRAYTSGAQEYVEATTFLSYMRRRTLPHWKEIQENLQFTISDKEDAKSDEETLDSGDPGVPTTITAMLTPIDYVLGVADLTGELMRLCINSLGMGNTNECFEVCNFAQKLLMEFSKIGHVPSREYGFKMHTFTQSLQKMESTCYNIVVRGEEVPKSLLAVGLQEKQQDEGFCD